MKIYFLPRSLVGDASKARLLGGAGVSRRGRRGSWNHVPAFGLESFFHFQGLQYEVSKSGSELS